MIQFMVAWVVIDRRHHRQAGPFAMLLPTPPFPSPHLSPLLPYSYGHSYTTATHQPLCNQSATHSFHRDGGCTPQAHSESRHSPLVTAFKFLPFKFLHTLLHSSRTQLFYFQAFPHSLPKTTRGGGRGYLVD